MSDNKKRNPNFSGDEVEVLTTEVSKHSRVLFGKLQGPCTASVKREVWVGIGRAVAGVSSNKRSVEDLKKKWMQVKCIVKSKASALHKQKKGTGGGPSTCDELTSSEMRIVGVIGRDSVEGIAGGWDSTAFLLKEAVDVDMLQDDVIPTTQLDYCEEEAKEQQIPVLTVKRMKSPSLVAEMSAFHAAVICESSRETFENQSGEPHKATITGVKRMKSSSLVGEMSAFHAAVICESSRETFENQSEEPHKATITGDAIKAKTKAKLDQFTEVARLVQLQTETVHAINVLITVQQDLLAVTKEKLAVSKEKLAVKREQLVLRQLESPALNFTQMLEE